ncbi:MAG TPA: GtrA family protein [Solirubrobacterales bacterium]|nr:GtrA family protein [Solirubrobacterales bacterium]
MSDGQNSLAVRLGSAARSRESWIQLLKFGVVGGSGYLINLGVFAFLSGNLGVYHAVAAVGAFCVAVTSNFLWNRYWTFGPGDGLAHLQAARFLAVSIGALVINLVVLELLVSSSGISELAAQAIAVAVAIPFNFLGNKLWTFT